MGSMSFIHIEILLIPPIPPRMLRSTNVNGCSLKLNIYQHAAWQNPQSCLWKWQHDLRKDTPDHTWCNVAGPQAKGRLEAWRIAENVNDARHRPQATHVFVIAQTLFLNFTAFVINIAGFCRITGLVLNPARNVHPLRRSSARSGCLLSFCFHLFTSSVGNETWCLLVSAKNLLLSRKGITI